MSGFADTCARCTRVATRGCSSSRSVSVTWMFISGRLTISKSSVLAWSWYLPGGSSRKPNLPFLSEVADFFSPPPSLDRYWGPNENFVLVRLDQAASFSPTAATN